MKTIQIVIVSLFIITSAVTVLAQEDITQAPNCKYCGMDREKFGHSRMVIEFDDRSSVGTCSLHCAAIELAVAIDKTPSVLWVADYSSKKLIDAEKAFWVIGGSKQGVMTKQPKWAFAVQTDAESFIKESGGKLATYDNAIKIAYEDMYQDSRMIREKRKMRKSQMPETKH
jgi:copper chaperone NosL